MKSLFKIKRPVIKTLLAFVFFLLLSLTQFNFSSTKAAGENWYNPSWQYRKKITIDHTQVSGSDLINLPILLKHTDSDLKSISSGGHVAQQNGNDLLFTLADGVTKLDHEIESYSPQTGTIIAWVKIPTVYYSTNTDIYVYYGNALCASQQNTTGVWNQNYSAVWHLNQISSGALSEFNDSTGLNPGQGGGGNTNYLPKNVIGKINLAQSFNGVNNYIDAKNTSGLNITGNAITLETWLKFDSQPTALMGIFSKGGFNGGYRWFVRTDSKILFQLPGNANTLVSSTALVPGNWYHLVATYNGSKMNLFINGNKETVDASKTNNITTISSNLWMGMGDYNCLGQSWCYPFKGTLEEARISNVARSQDWIKTEFNNQNSSSTFYTLGVEETKVAPSPTPTPTPTSTPTLIPTSTPTPITQDWSYKMVIDNSAHETYGAAYPLTYTFSLPQGITAMNVYKKYSLSSDWQLLPNKTSMDLFNGIEAARTDFSTLTTYVSVTFSDTGDVLYLKFVDSSGQKIKVNFTGMPQYYDNRKAVVVATADDWADYSNSSFLTAVDNFRKRNLWISTGIITGWTSAPTWQNIQTELDKGLVEPDSHSRTHQCSAYSDYDSEVGGSAQDIKNNLNLPAFLKKGTKQYVIAWYDPCHYTDATLRQKLGQYNYLVNRNTSAVNYDWATFDDINNLYNLVISTTSLSYFDEADLDHYFDVAYGIGKIYHLYFHPAEIDWSTGGKAQNHLDYISGKKDIWYAGLGQMYLYHYLQDRSKITVFNQ